MGGCFGKKVCMCVRVCARRAIADRDGGLPAV
jgi:hypothetical protein